MDVSGRGPVLFGLVGVVLGACWSVSFGALALVPLLAVAWVASPSRTCAASLMAGYYGCALRAVAMAGSAYFGMGVLGGAALYVCWVAVLSAPWTALWSSSLKRSWRARAVRLPMIWFATAAPGLGALGVAHPSTGAGLWFPGLGVWGVLALVVALVATTVRTAACATAFAVVACVAATRPELPKDWEVARTDHVPFALNDFGGQFDAALHAQAVAGTRTRITVLPEGAAGLWGRGAAGLWQEWARGRTVVVGAAWPHYQDGAESYDNVAINLATGGVYRQRVPMPVATWLPGSATGARAHWLGPGTLDVGGTRAGLLLCYETLLVWPALQSALEGAEVLVGMSNLAWFEGETVAASQRNALDAWGRLFGLPTAFAWNGGGAG